MIKYNDLTKDISEVFFSGHQITEVYIGTSKVFPDSTPPTPTDSKYRFTLTDQSVVSADCDVSSAITTADTITYRREDYNVMVSAEIGNCVTSIDNYAFACPVYFQNDPFTSVTIPSSVTSIGLQAFKGCSGLTSVVIPDSVTSIDNYAFSGCSSLTSCTISNNLSAVSFAMLYNCFSLPTITIPDSVTTIDTYAFYCCSGLTSVNMGSGVTSIGNQAFQYCSSLTSITIPSGLTSIGSAAFKDCSGLQKVIVPNIAAWCGFSFSAYEDSPLYYSHHLYSDENTEISNLAIPNGVTSIGKYAFNNCSGLTSVIIPNGITSIGRSCFENCYGLSSVTIGNSVTSIDRYVFYGCSALTSVTINTITPPTLGSAVFNGTNNCPIYVPAQSVQAYKTANNWSTYASRIQAIP